MSCDLINSNFIYLFFTLYCSLYSKWFKYAMMSQTIKSKDKSSFWLSLLDLWSISLFQLTNTRNSFKLNQTPTVTFASQSHYNVTNFTLLRHTGASDPYVKFKLNDETVYKSRCHPNTLQPRWDEKFTLMLHKSARLSVHVFDRDRGRFKWGDFLIEYFYSFVSIAKVKNVLVIMFVRDRVVSGSHFCFPRLVVFKKLLLICIFA